MQPYIRMRLFMRELLQNIHINVVNVGEFQKGMNINFNCEKPHQKQDFVNGEQFLKYLNVFYS